MKILMLEHFQGTGQPTLKKGEEREDIKPKLRDWLIKHGKAAEVKPEAPKPVVVEEKPGIKETLTNLFSSEPVVEKQEEVENVMQSPKPKKQPKKPTKKGKRKGGK